MKNKYLLFPLFLLTVFCSQAQDWSTDVYKYGESYPGYVIDNNNKKIEGFIKYGNRYSMQNTVLFFAEKGNKKTKVKYKTSDLKEYLVADKLYRCIHYSGGLLAKPIRANLVVKEGCIIQYVWYNRDENYLTMKKKPSETQEEFMTRMYPSKMVFYNTKTEEVKASDSFALKFAKKMAAFIADNNELAAKVSNGEKGYKLLSILAIIDEYNESCTIK